MKKKFGFILILFLIAAVQISGNSIVVKVGLFSPSQNSDLWEQNRYDFVFDKPDMLDLSISAEYEHHMGKFFSLSFEVGHYEKEVYTEYRDWVDEFGGAIYQNISLEISSLEAGFKFYPMGHRNLFNPYIGAGAGVYYWHYIQWGDFVDEEQEVIFENENAQTSTYTPGLNIRGGFIYRFTRSLGVSLEAKYLYLKGELSSFFEGFEKFDLSGVTFNLGISFYFD